MVKNIEKWAFFAQKCQSPTVPTRMRYPGVHVARPATFGSIYHLPIPENRKRKLRHCFRQSQLRILDAKFAIAENIAQTSQLG